MSSLPAIAGALSLLTLIACGSSGGNVDAAGQAGHDAGGAGGGAGGGLGGSSGGATAGAGGSVACSVPYGCCIADVDCEPGQECAGPVGCALVAGEQTTTGVCKPRPTVGGSCWRNDDCPTRACVGAQICPCGVSCLVADQAGSCEL